jgi:plastocyanin
LPQSRKLVNFCGIQTVIRWLNSILFSALLCFGATLGFAGAAIEGTVAIPPAKPVTVNARYQSKISGVIGQPSAPLAVVYLEGNFRGRGTTNISAKVIQQQFQFLPAVLPIQVGTTVEFPNLDDSYHNVFSYSKAKRFDLGRYRKDEKPAAITFDQAGTVKLFCEIHEHMRGTILVLNTPHFTRTDTNGDYRLERLPAGRFVLKAWLDDKTELKHDVELSERTLLRVDFPKP